MAGIRLLAFTPQYIGGRCSWPVRAPLIVQVDTDDKTAGILQLEIIEDFRGWTAENPANSWKHQGLLCEHHDVAARHSLVRFIELPRFFAIPDQILDMSANEDT